MVKLTKSQKENGAYFTCYPRAKMKMMMFVTLLIEIDVIASDGIGRDARGIRLKYRRIDTRTETPHHQKLAASLRFEALAFDESDSPSAVYLLQLNLSTVRAVFARTHNISLLEYVDHNSFAIEATVKTIAVLAEQDEVVWVGLVQPEDKRATNTYATNVTDGSGPANCVNNTYTNETHDVIVSLVRLSPARSQHDLEAFRQECISKLTTAQLVPVDVTIVNTNRLRIALASCDMISPVAKVVANIPLTLYVEQRLQVKLLNSFVRGVIEEGLSEEPNYDNNNIISLKYNLTGQGQIIGCSDSGVDLTSCFFSDSDGPSPHTSWSAAKPTRDDLAQDALSNARKVISYVAYNPRDSDELDGHGTHVAGTLAGWPENEDDDEAIRFSGIAPQAKLVVFDVSLLDDTGTLVASAPPDLGDSMMEWARVAGATIYSISWGDESDQEAQYAALSQEMDQYLWDHKEFSLVIAAGNSGSCGLEQTVTSFATAKNVISVGSTLSVAASYSYSNLQPVGWLQNPEYFDQDNIASFSSIGPVGDGRIVPTVVAPGFIVWSANSGDTSTCGSDNVLVASSGTSMSAPAVSAALALIRQYFEEGIYPTGYRRSVDSFAASSALLKAMIIAGATYMQEATRVIGTDCANEGAIVYVASDDAVWDHHQGFGRAQISNVLEFAMEPGREEKYLHLPGHTSNETTLGDPVMPETGISHHHYTFCASAVADQESSSSSSSDGTLVRVVLVWTDPPASLLSAVQLVNDLDLSVTYKNVVRWGNGGETADSTNNVEVIQFDVDNTESDIVVNVSRSSIEQGSEQIYSLVVVGPIRLASCSDLLTGESIDDGKDHEPTAEEIALTSSSETFSPDDDADEEFSIDLFTIIVWAVAIGFGISLLICLIRTCSCWRSRSAKARTAPAMQS